MITYTLALQAQRDLDQIWDYIATGSPLAADQVLDRMHETFQQLAEMPGLGHTRADVPDPRYRFWTVYSYLIVYNPNTIPLEIVRVVSDYRDLAGRFAHGVT